MSTSSLAGLSRASRMDPQSLAEANGLTDERFRGIANMGPQADAAFGSAPNPGGRPDAEAFAPMYGGPATRQPMMFKGGSTNPDAGDLSHSLDWWASLDGPYAPTLDSLPPSLRGLARST